jgi:hypothetical protein
MANSRCKQSVDGGFGDTGSFRVVDCVVDRLTRRNARIQGSAKKDGACYQ